MAKNRASGDGPLGDDDGNVAPHIERAVRIGGGDLNTGVLEGLFERLSKDCVWEFVCRAGRVRCGVCGWSEGDGPLSGGGWVLNFCADVKCCHQALRFAFVAT